MTEAQKDFALAFLLGMVAYWLFFAHDRASGGQAGARRQPQSPKSSPTSQVGTLGTFGTGNAL